MPDQYINLSDFYTQEKDFEKGLQDRLQKARREYPSMTIYYVGRIKGEYRPLANTHWLSKEDKRDPVKVSKSIADYKLDLWEKIRAGNPAVLQALHEIDDRTILACWCWPKPCHSQVIWAAWHWLKARERAGTLQECKAVSAQE